MAMHLEIATRFSVGCPVIEEHKTHARQMIGAKLVLWLALHPGEHRIVVHEYTQRQRLMSSNLFWIKVDID